MAIGNQFGETNNPNDARQEYDGFSGLAEFILMKVDHARDVRDTKYGTRWDEYTRLWRGFFTDQDKNTDSERSRLIAPALSQAIEMTVSEIEEAIFSRKAWFDVTDDIADQNKEDAVQYRNQLLEDFHLDGVQRSISDAILMGAIYGTGIAKINVTKKTELQAGPTGEPVEMERISVPVEAVRPDQFLIDPASTNIEEALFVAHEVIKPMHTIREKQRQKIYRKGELSPYTGSRPDTDGTGATANVDLRDSSVKIIEYAGRVPAVFLPDAAGSGMVEALVTLTEDGFVLRAVENPYRMKDRPYVAYQHDSVPGEFWGRGVAEKGYNPQKALDAELRARIDALALMSAPMMGADVSRLPRNADFRVRPGKTVFTRGRPSEILEPIQFGNPSILANTFQHTGDLERMIQMGTGAMDSATPVGVNARNSTASGISQLQAGFIKRSKRTMQNIERQFLGPLVRKSLWRYMQYDPERYPVDMKFRIDSAMGIMAKEVENSNLTNMLGYIPPNSPAHMLVVRAIFENSSSANKEELMTAIRQMSQGPTPEQQQMQQQMQELQQRMLMLEMQAKELENAKAQAEIAKLQAETRYTLTKDDLEDDKVQINASNAAVAAQRVRVQSQMADTQRQEAMNRGTGPQGTGGA